MGAGRSPRGRGRRGVEDRAGTPTAQESANPLRLPIPRAWAHPDLVFTHPLEHPMQLQERGREMKQTHGLLNRY